MVPLCLKREFAMRNFFYEYPNERVFYCSQWRWPPLVYVLIRALLACYSIYSLIHHFVDSRNNRVPSIVYFTVWSYILLSLHLLCAAVISILFYRRATHGTANPEIQTEMSSPLANQTETMHISAQECTIEHSQTEVKAQTDVSSLGRFELEHSSDSPMSNDEQFANGNSDVSRRPKDTPDKLKKEAIEEQVCDIHSTYESFKSFHSEYMEAIRTKWYFKISWGLSNLASTTAPLVTVIFFSALYPKTIASRTGKLDIQNTNVHVLNLVFVIIDHMISARPIRLLHAVAPIVYGFIYVIFSLIYWSTDKSNHVIYAAILDWNKPGAPIGLMFGLALVVIPLLQLAYFGIYQLKEHIHEKIYGCNFDGDID